MLWFTLGYLFYAFGFAAAGAMVARQQEVRSVSAPISVFLIGGFVLNYGLITSPDALWVKFVSYQPPLMPILMPARLALGQVAIWEMPRAILIMLTSIYGMARLGGRIRHQPRSRRTEAELGFGVADSLIQTSGPR